MANKEERPGKRTRPSISDKEALEFHAMGRPGKIEIVATKPMATQRDLSLAYSPGVAVPVKAIAENPALAFDYTAKGNLVAVISNGTAILGLGNLGALASKPVMEGKAVLFKRARFGFNRMCAFPLVHAFGAAFIDDAFRITENHILWRKAHGFNEFKTGNACSTSAIADKLGRFHFAAREPHRIHNASSSDDRCAMLIIMKHRNVHEFAQALLNDETFQCFDIL